MPRRVALPGADELFRSTGGDPRSSAPQRPAVVAAVNPEADPAQAARVRSVADRATTRRERHEEKFTVYVSPRELVELEQARLTLRANHGLAVDRGRIVREALAVVLADLDAKGEDSILARRLRTS